MADLLIVKNISREGPGLLRQILDNNQISFDIADLDANDMFPSPTDYKALVVLGGPDSANDTTGKMTQELEKVKTAISADMPYLGICLGMQLLVKAVGGRVVKANIKEVGFLSSDNSHFMVELTDAGTEDPLFTGLTESLNVFHLHGETVELTNNMTLLATGRYCRNQIVKVSSNAYGIQPHFELTSAMLNEWSLNDPDLIPIGNNQLQKDFSAIQDTYTNIGNTLFSNFLHIAGFM